MEDCNEMAIYEVVHKDAIGVDCEISGQCLHAMSLASARTVKISPIGQYVLAICTVPNKLNFRK
eukprot:scaffold18456_cov75-Skeletonema_dohrnii-CCMP3373.AAC.1